MANPALPRPDMPGPQPVEGTKVTPRSEQRQAPLLQAPGSERPDRIFKSAMTACGVTVLGVLVLIVFELIAGSRLSWHAFGFKFFGVSDWDPVNNLFGALPFIYGTLVSSLVALIIAVPLAVGVAVFTTEMCPKAFRGPISFFVELLAAIPSVIYGLWAFFILVPLLSKYVQPFLARTLGWTGLFEGPPYGIGMLAYGCAAASARGRSRPGRYPLGDDSRRRSAQRPRRNCGRNHSGPRSSPGRNHGRHHGDWKLPADCEVAVRSRLHPGQRAGQRV